MRGFLRLGIGTFAAVDGLSHALSHGSGEKSSKSSDFFAEPLVSRKAASLSLSVKRNTNTQTAHGTLPLLFDGPTARSILGGLPFRQFAKAVKQGTFRRHYASCNNHHLYERSQFGLPEPADWRPPTYRLKTLAAARELGVSVDKIRDWVEAGLLPLAPGSGRGTFYFALGDMRDFAKGKVFG